MIEPTRREDDERVGPRPAGPDPAKFWAEVDRRESLLISVPCGPDDDACDLDYFCKAHRLALDGPDGGAE